MSQALHLEWADEDQANKSFKARMVPHVRALLAAGKRVAVTVEEAEDDRTPKQNKFLWSFVYKTISEQALINGIGAQAEGWHDYYKKMFLGYQVFKVKVPGKSRPSVRRELRSTTGLSVRKMSKYLDQVMAHAAITFDVTFPADLSWENFHG